MKFIEEEAGKGMYCSDDNNFSLMVSLENAKYLVNVIDGEVNPMEVYEVLTQSETPEAMLVGTALKTYGRGVELIVYDNQGNSECYRLMHSGEGSIKNIEDEFEEPTPKPSFDSDDFLAELFSESDSDDESDAFLD